MTGLPKIFRQRKSFQIYLKLFPYQKLKKPESLQVLDKLIFDSLICFQFFQGTPAPSQTSFVWGSGRLCPDILSATADVNPSRSGENGRKANRDAHRLMQLCSCIAAVHRQRWQRQWCFFERKSNSTHASGSLQSKVFLHL